MLHLRETQSSLADLPTKSIIEEGLSTFKQRYDLGLPLRNRSSILNTVLEVTTAIATTCNVTSSLCHSSLQRRDLISVHFAFTVGAQEDLARQEAFGVLNRRWDAIYAYALPREILYAVAEQMGREIAYTILKLKVYHHAGYRQLDSVSSI